MGGIASVTIAGDAGEAARAASLGRAGEGLASDFETRAQGLSTLLEPLIIVFLGLTIGGILVAMYLPIFQLGQVF